MKLHKGTTVFVREGQFEKALRKFKKKVQKNGTIQEVRDRQYFEKPSMKKRLKKKAARSRHLKELRKQGQHRDF